MKAHVHARVLRRMTRGGKAAEKRALTFNQLLATSTEAGKCGGTIIDKALALYAQHDAGPKNVYRYLLTETRQLTHSMTSALEVAVDRT